MTADQLLTPEQVGQRLGVSARTIRRMVTAGEIGWVDIARPGAGRARIRVAESALAAYQARHARGLAA